MSDDKTQQATHISNNNKGLRNVTDIQQAAPTQMPLDLGVEVQKDVNGIEMGVLENGIPFLTQRGLAGVTGVTRSVIQTITQEWEEHYDDPFLGKDRISFFIEYLSARGYREPKLYIETERDGSTHYAYPDVVCMAFLEYYAFESKGTFEDAVNSYRQFAAHGLQKYIYEALDYTPADKWKYHNDRVSILKDASPPGHFTVFREITGLVVDLIAADLTVNDKTIPDISVGLAWGKHWSSRKLESDYGERIPYEHHYPDYYPQSTSNPQKPWAYPDSALPEFRKWFKETYLTTKFPAYILKKANVISGGKVEVEKIAGMYKNKELPPGGE